MSLLIRSDSLIRDFQKLDPPWGKARWNLEYYLEVFDESGDLRPRYRVLFPEGFAHYLAQREHVAGESRFHRPVRLRWSRNGMVYPPQATRVCSHWLDGNLGGGGGRFSNPGQRERTLFLQYPPADNH